MMATGKYVRESVSSMLNAMLKVVESDSKWLKVVKFAIYLGLILLS